MKEFKSGDVVKLASGGPKMTLGIYDADELSWFCQWFESGNLYGGDFYEDQLIFA